MTECNAFSKCKALAIAKWPSNYFKAVHIISKDMSLVRSSADNSLTESLGDILIVFALKLFQLQFLTNRYTITEIHLNW